MGDAPSGFGQGPAAQPPMGNWPPQSFGQPAKPSRPWVVIAIAVTAAIAITALVVALMRPTDSHSSMTTTTAPTHTATETATAQQRLCDTYKLPPGPSKLIRTAAIRRSRVSPLPTPRSSFTTHRTTLPSTSSTAAQPRR